MDAIPNLAKTATQDLVEQIKGGGFAASYINWSRTLQMLRDHAPGWMPELVQAKDGGIVHLAPVGAFLLIRFRHLDGTVTPEVPQAIMDVRNNAVPVEKITARDVTDTHRRGVCMAAAFTFGLAYELWAKLPLESGFQHEPDMAERMAAANIRPDSGIDENLTAEERKRVDESLVLAREYLDSDDATGAHDYLERAGLDNAEKMALWSHLLSYERAAIKLVREGKNAEANAHLIRNRDKANKKLEAVA